jgi:hypothetical protein
MRLPSFFLGAALLGCALLCLAAPCRVDCPNCENGTTELSDEFDWREAHPSEDSPRDRLPKGMTGSNPVRCSRCRATGRISLAHRLRP